MTEPNCVISNQNNHNVFIKEEERIYIVTHLILHYMQMTLSLSLSLLKPHFSQNNWNYLSGVAFVLF